MQLIRFSTLFSCNLLRRKSNRHVHDYSMIGKGFEPGYCSTNNTPDRRVIHYTILYYTYIYSTY